MLSKCFKLFWMMLSAHAHVQVYVKYNLSANPGAGLHAEYRNSLAITMRRMLFVRYVCMARVSSNVIAIKTVA